MSAGSQRATDIGALIRPVVAAAGYDLEGVTVTPAGKRRLVRIVVDGDDGVDLDDVAQLSRAVSVLLDEHDPMTGNAPYVLEVTSPGVDRPLSAPRHWRRALGRLVRVEIGAGGSDDELTGRVTAADDTGAVLDVAADGTGDPTRSSRRVEFTDVRSARVQVEFQIPERGRR